ncbi:MAG: VWA domain-containing protein, partial [Planctomycetota bacterium]
RKFGRKQLKDCLDLIRLGNPSFDECDDFREYQFLELLLNSLPFGRENFDSNILVSLIQVADASQDLMHGNTLVEDRIPNSNFDERIYHSNWKHLANDFEGLDDRFRSLLDDAILGKQIQPELEQLLADYQPLAEAAEMLYQARVLTEELLFVLPYVHSFNLGDAIFRDRVDLDLAFRIDPAKLENAKRQVQSLARVLAGKAIQNDQLSEVSDLANEVRKLSTELKKQVGEVAQASALKQSASRYVFEPLSLLASPVPEWLSHGSDAVEVSRGQIRTKLEKILSEQQAKFFGRPLDASEDSIDVDALEERHSEFSEKLLAKLQDSSKSDSDRQSDWNDEFHLNNESPIALMGVPDSWEKVQTIVDQLESDPSPWQSKLPNNAVGSEWEQIQNQLSKLDAIDFQIRSQTGGIGLSDRSLDVSAQQERLLQFEKEYRAMIRSRKDFWGSGNVKRVEKTVPAFLRQARIQKTNMENLAIAMRDLMRSQDRKFSIPTLSEFAEKSLEDANQQWVEFSSQPTGWIESGQPTDLQANQLVVEATRPIELDLGLDIIRTNGDYSPINLSDSSNSKFKPSSRFQLDGQFYFDNLMIPASDSAKNYFASGEVVFRGHLFADKMMINRKVKARGWVTRFQLNPFVNVNDKASITLSNDVNDKVAVIFLLDCSGSMGNPGPNPKQSRIAALKNVTNQILAELAASGRFHIGLAAFGHRSKFSASQPATGKYRVDGVVHPFEDSELIVPPGRTPTTNPAGLSEKLASLQPLGYTPLYYSIKDSVEKFPGAIRKKMLIVI